MKRIVLIGLMLISLSATTQARKAKTPVHTPASDSRIEYTGRTVVNGEDVSYDWSGVYCRIRFNGPSLAVRCSDSGNSWFNVWVDKEMDPKEDSRFLINRKDTVIVLAEGLGKGEHEVIIQKRTEGEQGRVTLHSFITEAELLQADARRERHIEFIGDSYTCGYGTESSNRNDPFKAETENCNLTYAAIVSRYFNADYTLVSHSGQGIARNYDDYRRGYNMPDRYSHAFDEDENTEWTPEMVSYRPDVVVIYLMTNDFSCSRQPSIGEFTSRYHELLHKVKKNYGEDIPILCIASAADQMCYDYLRTVCTTCGLKNIRYIGFTEGLYSYDNDLGASWHPNYKGQKKWASCLIPYISTATGWEMEEKPIR